MGVGDASTGGKRRNVFTAPNRAVEKFEISIADWSVVRAQAHFPLILSKSSVSFLTPSSLARIFPTNHGPFEAKGKGRCSESLCYPFCGCQKATVFISGLPEVMHPQRYAFSSRVTVSFAHLAFKGSFLENLVIGRKPTRARLLLLPSTTRRILLTLRMNLYSRNSGSTKLLRRNCLVR